jgi:hypothetical protein
MVLLSRLLLCSLQMVLLSRLLLCSCFSCGPPLLQVVKYPDPILRARNKRINTFDDNLRALTDEMFDVMNK